MRKSTFYIIANAALGRGLSGSDRIFIELVRRFAKYGHKINVCVWEEGLAMCQREGLKNVNYILWPIGRLKKLGFVFTYILRIVKGVIEALRMKIENRKETIVYAASDFWQDAFPAFILKKRFPQVTFIGTYYLAAPSPFRGFKEQGKIVLPTPKAIVYFVLQQPILFLLIRLADYVFVTSLPDVKPFVNEKRGREKIVVIRGGVNVTAAKNFRSSGERIEKIYTACFQGRFHPQKGVLELIDIWKKVVERWSEAKLVMIGDGPLFSKVLRKIKKLGLQDNVILKGYLFDGPEKYDIFKKSKLILHPAVYDSGGMAPAEAMAWGLPGVSFNLEALKTYYPKGMLKVKIGDLEGFVEKIEQLLTNPKLYEKTAKEAQTLVFEKWDWDKRAEEILNKIKI